MRMPLLARQRYASAFRYDMLAATAAAAQARHDMPERKDARCYTMPQRYASERGTRLMLKGLSRECLRARVPEVFATYAMRWRADIFAFREGAR